MTLTSLRAEGRFNMLCEKTIFYCSECFTERVFGCGPYLGPGSDWQPKTYDPNHGAPAQFISGDTSYMPLLNCEGDCHKRTRHIFKTTEWSEVQRAFPVRATAKQIAQVVAGIEARHV